jgi:hypothetical protein
MSTSWKSIQFAAPILALVDAVLERASLPLHRAAVCNPDA